MFSRLAVLVSVGAAAAASMLSSLVPPKRPAPASDAHHAPPLRSLPSPRLRQSLTVNTRAVNPGTSIATDQCFTFAFDATTASECGDLRVAHALPTTRVRGSARTPTLVYHAQHAHPYPVVRANVTIPSGTVSTATATLQLVVNGTPTTVATQNYTGTQLPGGSTRRIALTFDGISYPTGVYPYTLALSATVNGTTVQTQSVDTLVIVNRSTSEFGAGWWLAGYERLVLLPNGPMLWVGGDGSTRLYRRKVVGEVEFVNHWVTDTITRPDSIMSPLASNTFVRALEGGARVVFDITGEHIATINRLGDTTHFARTSGRLSGITLPRGTLTYAFTYDGNQKLAQITAPIVSGTRNVGTSVSSGRLTSITDPDGFVTTFAYGGSVTNLMTSRSDKHARARTFTFDGAARLAGTTVHAGTGSTDPITWAVCAAETRGLLGGGTCGVSLPPDTVNARTTIDGPRAVADTWNIAVNRYGAVNRLRDPRGSTSTLRRDDSRFPGLVTEATDPTGFVQQYSYNDRGNPTARWDLNAFAPGVSVAYSYAYGSTQWPDGVTAMFVPMGGSVQFTYDTRGNVLTREDYRGAVSRTSFNYGATGTSASGLLVSVVHPNTLAGRTDFDSLQYDALGNVSDTRTASRIGAVTTIHSATHTQSDAIGRVAQVCVDTSIAVTPAQQCTSTTFDRMDRDSIVTVTAPLGAGTQTLTTRSRYDREGRLVWLQRQSSSPDASIGAITTQWQYDSAGRRIVETAPDNQVERTFYDPAGNVERVITRKSDTVSMTYGLANELLTRRLSAVRYTAVTDTAFDTFAFPWKPNSGTDYLIPVDTQQFTYDSAGRILTANNRDARVTRTYLPNGLLASERQILRAANAATIDTTKHNYLLSFRYDLNGRRTSVKLPSQLASAGQDSLLRVYHPYLDDLLSISDPLGNAYTYSYTVRSEPATLDFPGGYQEQWTYSAAGYDSLDVITNPSTANGRIGVSPVRSARSAFDARGFRRWRYDAAGFRDTAQFTYTGLGHLASSSMSQQGAIQGGSARVGSREKLTYDALGNMLTDSTTTFNSSRTGGSLNPGVSSASQSFAYSASYQANVGRITGQAGGTGGARTYTYDAAGNTQAYQRTDGSSGDSRFRERRLSYYAADGTLAAADYRWRSMTLDDDRRRVFETYRYDALGRRVSVRVDRECFLANDVGRDRLNCDMSTLRRTVWEDERELIELQVPVKVPTRSAEPDSVLDNDLFLPKYPRVLNAQDPNPFFGRVVYTHGLTLDQPVALTRYNYVDFFQGDSSIVFPPTTVSLMWTALGKVGVAACADGKAECSRTISLAGGGTRTANLQIGLPNMWFAYERPKYLPSAFSGTLLDDKQTATGTHYRRNRYYDPGAGRFTQEDPIGLAGGLNLYGFAGSNPANFSDPFGLFTCPPSCGGVFQEIGRRLAPVEGPLEVFGTLATLPLTVGGAAGGMSIEVLRLGQALRSGAAVGISRSALITEGIYEFTATTGKTYVGQSSNISLRLTQHVRSGKLAQSDMAAVRRVEVLGGKLAREVAEQRRINELGGITNLENKINPLGPKRRYLLER